MAAVSLTIAKLRKGLASVSYQSVTVIFADRIAVIVRRCIAVWTGSNRDRSGLDVDPAYTDPIRIRCGSVFDVVWKGL